MKKNLFLLAGTVLFAFLFYNQEMGLNFSLFAIFIYTAIRSSAPAIRRAPFSGWLTAALAVTVGTFTWYGGPLPFLTLFATLVLIACRAYAPSMHMLLVPFSGALNFASFIFRAPLLATWLPLKTLSLGQFYKKVIYYFLIPGTLAVVFLIVYSSSSSLFLSFFRLNWNPDLFQIFILSGVGFFITFSLLHYWVPDMLLEYNNRIQDHFSDTAAETGTDPKSADAAFYRKSAEISLIVLNVLITGFIVTYCIEQFEKSPSGNLSKELHERVYLLIFSILMAIAVIMVFFQGKLNFDKKNRALKDYAFLWIGLNAVLILVVVLKNNQYVTAYGLTFKRIGVYIFLLLTALGLWFTMLKIKHRKTNSYLLSRMVWTGYTALVIGCAVNWSWIVTKYNHSKQSTWDIDYVKDLPYNKQLLYDIYMKDAAPEEKQQFLQTIETEKNRPLLSRHLYYQFIQLQP
ncbi:DUF4173 domain-containing protein [Niabella beijingensis]|uniref:DUF4153 domain-containing protein n=1 Tax=Niabella beijingensis TaxID=2872700 RepID=UPI001CC0802E|nr:DUF4173 domain-containing protein [Niabella beijingensis]MBZ4190187.1 DUF4173 domain-containing protein [Niabella beijingensis]